MQSFENGCEKMFCEGFRLEFLGVGFSIDLGLKYNTRNPERLDYQQDDT